MTDRNTIYNKRHFLRWLHYGERRYIVPRPLVDLAAESGLPDEDMRPHTDAAMMIHARRRKNKLLTIPYIDLWWKTRGYRIVR